MITKKIIAPLFIVILLAGIGGVLAAKNSTNQRAAKITEVSSTPTEEEPESTTAQTNQLAQNSVKAGRYTQYDASAVSSGEYKNTVLFFHAAWCPECRAFDKAISESTVPENIQILKVDYDKSTDLRKKYGVTLQSTFVSVNSNGDQIAKWVGYGKDKSANAVLSNLKL